MEKSQQSAPAIEKHGGLTEQQIAQRARVLIIHKIVSSTRGDKRMEFVNRFYNSTINFRQCMALKTRPEEKRRSNFVGQCLRLEVRPDKLKLVVCGRPKKDWEACAPGYQCTLYGRGLFFVPLITFYIPQAVHTPI
jgi:hypothetical protein